MNVETTSLSNIRRKVRRSPVSSSHERIWRHLNASHWVRLGFPLREGFRSDSQEAELRAAGATRVYVDRGESSRVSEQPQWVVCLDHLRLGDTLVIRALDRVAGTERMAIETIRDLGKRGVRLKSLTEPFLDVDTFTPMGEAVVGIMAVMAQLRVSTIRENTMRGLAHARSQGRAGGRPTVMTEARIEAVVKLRHDGKTLVQIAEVLGVGKSSVARALNDSSGERDSKIER